MLSLLKRRTKLRLAYQYTANHFSCRNDSESKTGARQVDEKRRGVLPTLPHLRQPVRPETEQRTAIRQTVPTKASVEAETSTIINKILFFLKEFHFELDSESNYSFSYQCPFQLQLNFDFSNVNFNYNFN